MVDEQQPQYQMEYEFKKLDPDYWIHFAVMQCLQAQVTDAVKYVLSVDNLQSVVIRSESLALKFDMELNEQWLKLIRDKGEAHKNEAMQELAKWKFRKLLAQIEHQRTHEVEYSL